MYLDQLRRRTAQTGSCGGEEKKKTIVNYIVFWLIGGEKWGLYGKFIWQLAVWRFGRCTWDLMFRKLGNIIFTNGGFHRWSTLHVWGVKITNLRVYFVQMCLQILELRADDRLRWDLEYVVFLPNMFCCKGDNPRDYNVFPNLPVYTNCRKI